MICILCALKIEAKPYIHSLVNRSHIRRASVKIHRGTIGETEMLIAVCGAGIKKAGEATRFLLDNFAMHRFIMSGTAGGIDGRLGIGDTVVSEEVVFHDGHEGENTPFRADAALLSQAKDAIKKAPPAHPVYFGRMATGASFVTGKKRDEVSAAFNPLCADMETAAAALVCRENNVPFIAVRSITDTREKSGLISFFNNAAFASTNSFAVVMRMLGIPLP
jgi:adenosylhomocysteine nucleosidase